MTTPKEIDTSEDILDSRDIIERLKWLEDAAEADEEKEELETLKKLDSEGRDTFSDWGDGVTLVRESYFQDYAQELAEDIGAVSKSNDWPNYCIDWEWAARELKMDYSTIEIDGIDYYGR